MKKKKLFRRNSKNLIGLILQIFFFFEFDFDEI